MIRDLKRRALDNLRSPSANAEEIGVRNDAEGSVVSDDAAGVVPFSLLVGGGQKGLGDRERGLEDAGLFLWERDLDLGPISFELSSRSTHG